MTDWIDRFESLLEISKRLKIDIGQSVEFIVNLSEEPQELERFGKKYYRIVGLLVQKDGDKFTYQEKYLDLPFGAFVRLLQVLKQAKDSNRVVVYPADASRKGVVVTISKVQEGEKVRYKFELK